MSGEWILFVIFLLCDLLIVPLCRFAYKNNFTYHEGMILNVHIPADQLHHPEVEQLSQKAGKHWQAFQRINLVIGLAVCFLCFADIVVFIVVWCIWLAEYIIGLYVLILAPHRAMYRIKLAHGWILESSRRIVRIDTAASAASEKSAPSWKWHLPILAATAATVFLICGMNRRYGMAPAEIAPVWILYATGTGLCLMFLLMHLWMAHYPNRVYSENSDVNLTANTLTKRAWTEGFLFASWLNGAAWIFMAACFFLSGPNLPEFCYLIYTILLLLTAAAFLLPVGLAVRKRQLILDTDPAPYYVDDDEYWKWGWYHNPDDRRLFVQNRFSSTNYSLNFGRPGAKVFILTILAAAAAVLIWAFAYMSSLPKTDIQLRSDGRDWQIEAAGYDCEFQTDEILSVDLPEELPDNGLSRSNGLSTPKLQIGHYRDEENAKYMLFVHTDASPVLKIELEDMTIFVNSRDAETTTEWYDRLEKEFNEKEPNE